jgi:hypothetical protein
MIKTRALRIPGAVLLGIAIWLPVGVTAAEGQARQLDEIIALCARQPESAALASAWSAYVVQYHAPDGELDLTIERVLDRASTYRQSHHGSTGKLSWTAAERQQARSFLYRTARAAFAADG